MVLLSIVILNYNGKHLLKLALESIRKQVFPYGKIETIVVDNCSSDGSLEYLQKEYPDIRIIENKENYGTSGINVVINKAKGDYIFFLVNFDIELDKYCLKNLFDVLKSEKGKVVCSPTIYDYKERKGYPDIPVRSRSFYQILIKGKNLPKVYEIPTSAFLLVKKSIFKDLKYYFDPNFFLYAEDLDLGLRLRLIGYKIVGVSDAIVYHINSVITKKYFSTAKLTFFNERNQIFSYLKVCSLGYLILLFPYVFLMRILTVLRDIIKLDFGLALSRIKAYFWILLHLNLILKSRLETQKTRKVSDKFVFKICDEKKFLKNLFQRKK